MEKTNPSKFKTNLILILICLFLLLGYKNRNTILSSDNNIVAEETMEQSDNQEANIVKVFHSPYCPHCHHLNDFIESDLKEKYPAVIFEMHDISDDGERQLLRQYLVMAGLDANRLGTPTVFVGTDHMIGFGSPQTSGQTLIGLIEKNFFDGSQKKK